MFFAKDERISLKKCKIFAAFLRDYDNSNNNYWPYGNTIKEYCLAVLKNLERTLGEGLKNSYSDLNGKVVNKNEIIRPTEVLQIFNIFKDCLSNFKNITKIKVLLRDNLDMYNFNNKYINDSIYSNLSNALLVDHYNFSFYDNNSTSDSESDYGSKIVFESQPLSFDEESEIQPISEIDPYSFPLENDYLTIQLKTSFIECLKRYLNDGFLKDNADLVLKNAKVMYDIALSDKYEDIFKNIFELSDEKIKVKKDFIITFLIL